MIELFDGDHVEEVEEQLGFVRSDIVRTGLEVLLIRCSQSSKLALRLLPNVDVASKGECSLDVCDEHAVLAGEVIACPQN